jgi:hypothetical protein
MNFLYSLTILFYVLFLYIIIIIPYFMLRINI